MKIKSKKLLALLLTFAMILSILPFNAFAEGATSAPSNASAGSVTYFGNTLVPDTYYKVGDDSALQISTVADYNIHLSADSSTLTLNNMNHTVTFQHPIINSGLDDLTIHSNNSSLTSKSSTAISGNNLTFTGNLNLAVDGTGNNGILSTGDINIVGNIDSPSIHATGKITISSESEVDIRAAGEDPYAISAMEVIVNNNACLNAVASLNNAVSESIAIDAILVVNDGGEVLAFGGSGTAGGDAILRAEVNGGSVIATTQGNGDGIARDLTVNNGAVTIDSRNGNGIGYYATVSGGTLAVNASEYGIADGGVGQDTTITGGNVIITGGTSAFETKPTVTPKGENQAIVMAGASAPGELKDVTSSSYGYTDKYVNINIIKSGQITLAGTPLTEGYHKFAANGTHFVGTSSDYNVRLVSQNGINNLYFNELSISSDFASEALKTTGDITVHLSGTNSINNTRIGSTAITAENNITFTGGGSLIIQGNDGVGINATGAVTVTNANTSVTSTGDAANGITASSVLVQNNATLSSLGTLNSTNITVNNATISGSSLTDYGIDGAVHLYGEGSATASGATNAFSQKPVIHSNLVTVNGGDTQGTASLIADLTSPYHQNKYVKIDFKNTTSPVTVLGTNLLKDTYYLIETPAEGNSTLKTLGANATNYHLHLSADGSTLTMNSAVMKYNNHAVEFENTLTIQLIGTNKIDTFLSAITSDKNNLTIKADNVSTGSLEMLSSRNSAINIDGILSITNCTIKATTEETTISGEANGISANQIIIDKSNVEAVGGNSSDTASAGSGIWGTHIYITNSTVTATTGLGTDEPAIKADTGDLSIENSILTANTNTSAAMSLDVAGDIRIGLGSTVNTPKTFGNKAPLFPAGATVKVNGSVISSPESGIGNLGSVRKVEVSSEVSTTRTMLMDFSHLQYRSVQGDDYGIQGDLIYLGTHVNPVGWIKLNEAGLMLSRSVSAITYDNLTAEEKIAVSGTFSNLSNEQVTSLVGSSSRDDLHTGATTRPTLALSRNAILFYTQTDGSTVEGAGTALGSFYKTTEKKGGTSSTSEWKLRIQDSGRNFSVSNVVVKGNKVTYDYANAKTGTDEYVSVLILDDSGKNILYYGKILDLSGGSTNSTNNIFTLPDEIAKQSSVRLQFINENESGTEAPNISSAFVRESEVETNTNPGLPRNITITATTNGSVSTNPESVATVGSNVAITAAPAGGYEIDTVTVMDSDGINISVNGAGSIRTFSMPDKDVTVTVTFKEKVLPPATHNMISGANQSAKQGQSLSFTSDGEYANFQGVEVDGNELTRGTHYTDSEGSTIITLHGSYTETLSLGEHTIEIISSTGVATAQFTITAQTTPTPTPDPDDSDTSSHTDEDIPQTGDNTALPIFVALLLASILGMGTMFMFRKMSITTREK